MSDYPDSLPDFQRRFPDDAACAEYLAAVRWPEGFRCPACGHDAAWTLRTKAWTYECRGCRRQASVRAGTILHGSKLALTLWFWAAYLMATHSNGISALQLQKQLGLGSCKSAWLLCAKLRRAMVAPERNPLTGLIEIDETTIHHRTKEDPPAGGQGRSHDAKLLIAGAVEIKGQGRLAGPCPPGCHRELLRCQPARLHGRRHRPRQHRQDRWLAGLSGRPRGQPHEPHVIGDMAAHIVLPWIHRVFANLKTWALGVYHGLRAKHLQAYLDEFVFRFNRRRTRHAAFCSLLAIASKAKPLTYKTLIAPEVKG